MKKTIIIISIIAGIAAIYTAWNLFGPTLSIPEKKFFYVYSGSDYEKVRQSLLDKNIIKSKGWFDFVSKRLKYPNNIKPGKYEIKEGMSLFGLIRTLKSGNQTPVRLVINKIRTKEDLAGKIGKNFETDSATAIRFLTSNDSLSSFGLDTNTVMTIVIPNSYMLWWNGSFRKIITRLKDQHDKFWEGKRTEQAKKMGFIPSQVYTIASIVEEETLKEEDKGKIASVYMNRISKDMKLEADPTVKYAMRDFGLKRILHGHLKHSSPYNTYQNKGLPPGPICTPSMNTIDAVLNAPKTDYIFFVAKPDFKGYSNFAATYPEHQKYAKAYQQALDSLFAKRKNLNQTNKP